MMTINNNTGVTNILIYKYHKTSAEVTLKITNENPTDSGVQMSWIMDRKHVKEELQIQSMQKEIEV